MNSFVCFDNVSETEKYFNGLQPYRLAKYKHILFSYLRLSQASNISQVNSEYGISMTITRYKYLSIGNWITRFQQKCSPPPCDVPSSNNGKCFTSSDTDFVPRGKDKWGVSFLFCGNLLRDCPLHADSTPSDLLHLDTKIISLIIFLVRWG